MYECKPLDAGRANAVELIGSTEAEKAGAKFLVADSERECDAWVAAIDAAVKGVAEGPAAAAAVAAVAASGGGGGGGGGSGGGGSGGSGGGGGSSAGPGIHCSTRQP